ncbi:WDR17, partial [Symbiodinium sp. CCMP2456]
MLRPLRLIPSGVQGYHRDTIAASSDAFAYSSTMSLHIFRLKDNTLQKMIAAHERAISAICWCPEDNNLLASCSLGMRIAIWDVDAEEERHCMKVPEVPLLMDWPASGNQIVFATTNGSIMFWDYKANRTAKAFSVPEKSAKVLRSHPRAAQKLL